ncbi:MAG: hypothetical protein HC817_08610 [Saprospiraceae bacterium]|nr:hypothetical protein [Saprospiraceae bacterium]
MITAVKLERAYTKEEIITMYLNTYDFGYNAHGIRAAAEVYFSKAPEQLTIEESATLVGMCQNSSLFNPIKRNEKTRLRRNKVLERCFNQNVITEKQYRELVNKPLDVSKFKNRTHNDGLATYFRMSLANEVRKLLKDKGILKPDGTTYDVYRDGLKIHTTINPEMQRLAEESMREHMRTLQAKYFKVWRGRDPWTYRDSETGDEQIRERLAILDAQIRQTNRYQLMRSRFLDGVLTDIESELDTVDVMDSDIINMLRQEKQPTLFETMQKNRSLSTNKIAIYRTIMTNENWTTLKKQWSSLQSTVKSEFAKRVPMKVLPTTPSVKKTPSCRL